MKVQNINNFVTYEGNMFGELLKRQEKQSHFALYIYFLPTNKCEVKNHQSWIIICKNLFDLCSCNIAQNYQSVLKTSGILKHIRIVSFCWFIFSFGSVLVNHHNSVASSLILSDSCNLHYSEKERLIAQAACEDLNIQQNCYYTHSYPGFRALWLAVKQK